jgi:mono/diheme cytochrome c family protein
MRFLPHLLVASAALLTAAGAHAQGTPSRGQLLYTTHCIECHTTQVHWRDQRRARDWDSLKVWVRHWQGEGRLQWADDDVEAVARYLNEAIYQFPQRQAVQ